MIRKKNPPPVKVDLLDLLRRRKLTFKVFCQDNDISTWEQLVEACNDMNVHIPPRDKFESVIPPSFKENLAKALENIKPLTPEQREVVFADSDEAEISGGVDHESVDVPEPPLPIDAYAECAECGKWHYTHADEKHAFVSKDKYIVLPPEKPTRRKKQKNQQ